jgi:hypothetical protein
MKKYILATIVSLLATGFIFTSAFSQVEIAPTASPWYQKLVPFPRKFRFKPSAKAALNESNSNFKGSFGAHIMPINFHAFSLAKAQTGTPAKILLSYYGGPLLTHVKVVVVYWNKDVAFQDQIPGFFANITQSPFFDWLKEYRTPSQSIEHGSLEAIHLAQKAPFKNLIEDSEIQSQLARMIQTGSAPPTDKDTLYMIYFPPRMQIDLAGQKSCEVFCAYHNSFLKNGEEINYGVIPDQGGACDGGCGPSPSRFDNETSVSSHELTEAVTDPAVGLVKGSQPTYPLGWYNASAGEIGDICADKQGTVDGYIVQKEWSNSRQTCVSSSSDPGSPIQSPN